MSNVTPEQVEKWLGDATSLLESIMVRLDALQFPYATKRIPFLDSGKELVVIKRLGAVQVHMNFSAAPGKKDKIMKLCLQVRFEQGPLWKFYERMRDPLGFVLDDVLARLFWEYQYEVKRKKKQAFQDEMLVKGKERLKDLAETFGIELDPETQDTVEIGQFKFRRAARRAARVIVVGVVSHETAKDMVNRYRHLANLKNEKGPKSVSRGRSSSTT